MDPEFKKISNSIEPVSSGVKRPRWSVMIPTFNPNEEFIKEAINSVVSQGIGIDDMQIEVVDDCSTKVDIPKIIEENWKGRVGYHRLPKNVGHSFNFTESVRRAKGELIHLLHDDDLVKPGFYSKFEDIFDKYENIGATFCRQEYIDDDGKFMFYSELEMEKMGILDDALVKLAQKQRIQYCAMVIRRKAFEQIGGFVTKNIGCEDWEMWVRIASHFPIAYEPEALAQYRIHKKSMTLTDMRSGQDMRFLREAAEIFTQYLPEEKRKEVTLFRNKHYATYSLGNAKRMFEEFKDEEGAAAQLSETIKLDSEVVYENLDFLKKFKLPVNGTGVSVIINCNEEDELIEKTLRNLANQRVPKYIPWEIVFAYNSNTDNQSKGATAVWKKYNSKAPFNILPLKELSAFESRKAAIEKAKYNFIVFCNPGNFLNIDYIERVSKKMLEDKNTGAAGGFIDAISDQSLPKWFETKNNNYYELGEQYEFPATITWSKGYLWSSGMAVRKEAWTSLIDKNFNSLFDVNNSSYGFADADREICYALRSGGWDLKYTFDLKLKNFIPLSDLSWRHYRKLHLQQGINSVILSPYQSQKNHEVEDFKKLHPNKSSEKLILRTCRKLQSFKSWKLNDYAETLEGDKDILEIEFLTGRLIALLKNTRSYNKRLRILKKVIRKKNYRYLRNVIENIFFRFPRYKILNTKEGVSVVLNYQNSSSDLLLKSIEKISQQKLHEDFPFELIVVSGFIKKEIQDEIFRLWKDSGCRAKLTIECATLLTEDKLRQITLEKSSYNYLILLTETDLLNHDYIRIAYRVLQNNKNAGMAGGDTSLANGVKPPKWFNSNKTFFSIGSPSEISKYAVNGGVNLWNAAVVLRKKALEEITNITTEFSDNPSPYFETNLTSKIRSCGWEVYYEERLHSEKFIRVKNYEWSHVRDINKTAGELEIRSAAYLKNIKGSNGDGDNGKTSWIYKANKTLGQINRYPFKKIFSGKDEFKGDSEVLEIEKLKGKFKELVIHKNRYSKIVTEPQKMNGNGHHYPKKNTNVEDSLGNIGVSIVICCYNSAKVLPLTLKYILRQDVPDDVPWEIIIVDNASTDNTTEVAQKIYDNSTILTPFRIVKEMKPGLSEARLKGFKTAKYDFILFCDDDNLLDRNFVRYVYEIMNGNKRIGVLGGQSKPEFDTPAPQWFDKWKNSFAIGKQHDNDGDITRERGYVWGASMVIRKQAWKRLQSHGFKTLLTDRKGNRLSAGGDTELCYAIRNDGWKIWYDHRLKFKHYITKDRLNWNYLRKLFRGFGQASAGLDHYLKNIPENFSDGHNLKPGTKRIELHKAISKLNSLSGNKVENFQIKREGDSDLPFLEYWFGRLEGLLKTRGSYNRGLRLLKRSAKKKDYLNLSSAFNNDHFPRYNNLKMLNGVSVIVCTYNGAERLADTIRYIAKQKVDPRILWEVILVDNASTDNSKEVTINEWKKHKVKAKLKIIDQPKPGKQLALEKGYESAGYEFLITCDDDNWLDENFVQLTYEIMSGNEKIGALGGPNEPVCEVDPPEWFKYFKRDYAAGPQPDVHTGKISEGNITWKRGYVWGAGMIVRKSAWDKLIKDGFKTYMSCRKGSELSSGGDSEACYALVLAGWQIWYDSRLKLKHCMPAGRLDWNYLVRLFVGFGTATVGLEAYEKSIRLSRADATDADILKQDWKYEFKKAITEIRKYGIKKILSLRLPQNDNTDILMLEFYISKLKELLRVRKEYDKNFENIRNSPWKKDFKILKSEHRKYLEAENDFRYGWPWSNDPDKEVSQNKIYPKISILSPSFNSAGTIEKAILSVVKQNYPNFEHIICDAGSSDGTKEILKKYSHLKWVSEPDKGQSDAMNKAFDLSDGDIIAYLNVDDYFQRNAFFKISDAFEKDKTADMIIGNLFFDFEGHTYTRVPDIEYKKVMQPFKHMFPINPVSYFYKRDVQKKIGPFPIENHMTMDYWFLLKAYQNFNLIQTDAYLGTFCMNGYNKTSNADNRKNTHERVLYHCWHYDKKNLPFYLYNYYKHFYYDEKGWNLKRIGSKAKKFAGRIYSILTFKKNKYYSQKLFERSRYKYFEKRRISSISDILASFVIYPKGLLHRSKQSQFLYSVLGMKYSEKAKIGYFFLTTPPGLPLANKLHYYGREFKNNKKNVKGNSLLMLTYIISPKFLFKQNRGSAKNSQPFIARLANSVNPVKHLKRIYRFFKYKHYRETSYNLFNKAGEKYYFHKNIQATFLMVMSFFVYPASLKKKSRLNLFAYSFLGNTITEKLKFAYHLYKDNPEYSLAHKINYYGNQLRKENHTVKGNVILIFAYILSPKYLLKREKFVKSNIVYASEFVMPKNLSSHKPKIVIPRSNHKINKIKYVSQNPGVYANNFYLRSAYKLKSFYHYFRYRKYKAQSKDLYARAIICYNENKRLKVVSLILPSYILYPKSITNKNKLSLIMNSIFGEKLIKKVSRRR